MNRPHYRICSGQSRTRGGPDWGICLADPFYRLCQWWRHETADGRRQLTYRTPEQAERVRQRLELQPLPPRLAKELERQRKARAARPGSIDPVTPSGSSSYWLHACSGCAADGLTGLKPEFRT